MRTLLVVTLLLHGLLPAAAQSRKKGQTERQLKRAAIRLLARVEVPLRAKPPAWALLRRFTPRFRFAVLSDIHLGRSDRVLRLAIAELNRLRPDFVVITGDNVSGPTIAQHRRLQRLLGDLVCRYHIVKGDNDARNYDRVFGATHWSFVYGGVHFLGSGLDVDVESKGIGFQAPRTLRWLAGRLDAHRERPTLYFQHESSIPPSFLGAPRLLLLLLSRPQLAGVITGHLHHDLGLRLGRTYFLGAPGLGPSPRHGFKLCSVHPDGIIVRTAELEGGRYRLVEKWQRIRFPQKLHLPPTAAPALAHYQALPPAPTRFDPGLTRRYEAARATLERWGESLRRLLGG